MGEATRDVLERWEQSGAIWRVRTLSASEAVVDLCTCFGEPVEVLRSQDAGLLRYLAARRSSDDDPDEA
jgi:hypothetical protein